MNGQNGENLKGGSRKLHNETILISTVRKTLILRSDEERTGGVYGGRTEMHTGFWYGNLMKEDTPKN